VAQTEFSWTGSRADLDLDRFWWHRLAKVTYVFGFLAAVGIAALVVFDGNGPSHEANFDRVRISANLNDLLMTADTKVPDVIPTFLLMEGKLGIRNEVERKVDPGLLTEYYLNRSICTPDALLHAQAVAESINARTYTNSNSATTVMKSILNTKGEYEEQRRFCWFDSGLSSTPIQNIVKYEFTPSGAVRAYADYFGNIAFWFILASLIATNIYFRGFVYVICGPRGKVKEKYLKQPPEEPNIDDDDDWDEPARLG
jgi:hypothetical protein